MTAWYTVDDCDVAAFASLVATPTDSSQYPRADRVEQGVLVYDASRLRGLGGAERRWAMAELASALREGPGIVVLEGAFDAPVVDRATEAFRAIIAAEKAAGTAPGDHFAAAGANDRVWNALEKLAVADPAVFVDYYANPVVALVCEAWLGPGYQVTSQVNQVNPGGQAQSPHRDYHLGFQTADAAAAFPAHAHELSAVLTLQGAVAHVDMPVESGPTLYLPHSQKFGPGYLAWQLPAFKEHFAAHHVQLPLAKGDAVFFNPALHHAAGSNVTSGPGGIARLANLLQVSSPFGRAMEAVDRARITRAIYPVLIERREAGMPMPLLGNAIAAAAEGYAFPTNLDRDQPQGSAAPPTQADLVRRALDERWDAARLEEALDDWAAKRGTA